MAAAACALCDALHELGHLAATLLPLDVTALAVSSVGVSTTASHPAVACAGPLVNVLLAASMLLARSPAFGSTWRYAFWLFGTFHLFNATAYLMYSGILGSGDWASVIGAYLSASLWRPIATLIGIALYAGATTASLAVLRALVSGGVVTSAHARRDCRVAYAAGGLVLTAASALNPISPWLILTSGVATGFGAMVGLVLIAKLLTRGRVLPNPSRQARPARFGRAWLSCSLFVAVAFVLVLGPGLELH